MQGSKGGQSTAAGVYSIFMKNSKFVVKRGAEVNRKGVRGGRLSKWGERICSKEGYVCQRYIRSFVQGLITHYLHWFKFKISSTEVD